jgi:hypothetical protein
MSRFFAVTASILSIPARHGEHGSGDPRWLPTPCTVRLGEPNWTLRCLTPSVARRCYRESSVLSRSPQALAVLRRRRLVNRRARARCRATGLGQHGHLTQDAFDWRDARPCGRVKPMRVHLTFTRAWLRTPFRSPRRDPSSSGWE